MVALVVSPAWLQMFTRYNSYGIFFHTEPNSGLHTHLPIKVVSTSGINETSRANLLQQDIHQLIAAFALRELFPAGNSTLHIVCALLPVWPADTF